MSAQNSYTFEVFQSTIKPKFHGPPAHGPGRGGPPRGGPKQHLKSIPHGFLLDDRFVKEGLEKMRKMSLRPDDVWVVTPPKCGTTWMQELSWCVGNNMDLKTAKEVIQFYRFPFVEFNLGGPIRDGAGADISKLEKTKDNIMTFMANSFEYTDSMASPRFIKTHLPLCFLPEDLLKTCKVIYVARNVKDSCVSSFYHMRQPAPFDQYAKAFRNGEIMVGNWFEHIRQAWEVREEENMEFVWYEDMKEDIRSVIKNIAKHLGKNMSEDDIETLVKHLDIDQFKANSSVNKAEEMPSSEERPSFVRKGIVGDWKNHFTNEESMEWDSWITRELERTGIKGMRGWK